jgi:hypothetical protein
MSSLCHRTALAALLAASTAAAEDKPAEVAKPAPRPAEVVAQLHDGTVIRKAALRDAVVVATRFGKLTVPAAEVRRIEFGRHVPAEVARQVEEAVKQLASNEYKQREAAGQRLVALGARAYPALQAAATSPDKEVAARAKAALERVRKEVRAELLSLPEQDVVYTRDCVLAGRVEGEALRAHTASLGELSLRFAVLRSLHSAAVDRSDVAVEAAQFGNGTGKWADSGVTVEAGVGLAVSASGRVDLMPAQAGQHLSGPAGYPAQGSDGRHQAGTLLGRLGEDGPVFAVGQQYEGRSGKGGKLYLYIVPLAGGNGSTGAYQVKVKAGPGVEARAVANMGSPPAAYGRGYSVPGFGGSGLIPLQAPSAPAVMPAPAVPAPAPLPPPAPAAPPAADLPAPPRPAT